MRIVYFALAVVFSLLAIAIRFTAGDTRLAVAAVVCAGVFLALGFWAQAKKVEPDTFVLSPEQEDTLRRMVADGNRPGAIEQYRLWSRHASTGQARADIDRL